MPDWPHSPIHRLSGAGAYIVTAGTYQKKPVFRSRARLTFLCEMLLQTATAHEWALQAWAVFPNHYHFVAVSPGKAEGLPALIGHLHRLAAAKVNLEDGCPGRQIWFQYWESHLTFQRSYLARLNYVHTNAVRHGLVRVAAQYEWCSAGWFERTADRPFYQTVMKTKSEGARVLDDFEVDPAEVE
jgi:putative transposase